MLLESAFFFTVETPGVEPGSEQELASTSTCLAERLV